MDAPAGHGCDRGLVRTDGRYIGRARGLLLPRGRSQAVATIYKSI